MPAVDPTKYPKAKYHATDPSRLVANPDEEKELGLGWFDHPDLAKQPQEEPKAPKVKTSAVSTRDAS